MKRSLRRALLGLGSLAGMVALLFAAQHVFTAFAANQTLANVATPTPAPSPPPAPAGRAGIGNWPFQSHSPWNVPMSRTADYEASTTACSKSFHSSSGEPTYLSAANWSHSVFQAHSTDPWANIYYNLSIYNHPGVIATIRIPTYATPSPPPESQGGDARMYILDPSGHYVDEMWKASKNANGSWSVGSYKRNDLFSMGILQGGMRAYGGSALGGLIRKGEFNGSLQWPSQAYQIEHAIPHAIPIAITRALEVNSWVWPANSNDVDGKPDPEYKGVVPMGQFVALPGNIDITKIGLQTMQGVELAFALQNYGAYLVDSSSNYSYYAETAAAGDIGQINHSLNGHPADIETLQHLLVCVDKNGPNSPGSGSWTTSRRTCWAPWLPTETPIAGQCVYNRP